MLNNYALILDLVSKIEEWNIKINNFTGRYMDNPIAGAAVIIVILVVAYSGINTLNKK